jgi:membrane protein
VLRWCRAAARGYGVHSLSQHAAAISFRVLFSFVPLVALTVSLLYVLLPGDLAERLVDWLFIELAGAPELEDSVDRAVVGGRGTASVAGMIALVGLIWGATGVMSSMRFAFRAIWETAHRRPFVRGRLLDVALVFATGLVVIVGFALGVVAEAIAQLGGNLGDALGLTGAGDRLGEALGIGASLFVTLVCFASLYRVVPPVRPRWKPLLPGAVVGAVGFQLVTIAYGWYLARFGDLTDLYGSLGALLGFLLVVYAGVVAILIGAEIVVAESDADA